MDGWGFPEGVGSICTPAQLYGNPTEALLTSATRRPGVRFATPSPPPGIPVQMSGGQNDMTVYNLSWAWEVGLWSAGVRGDGEKRATGLRGKAEGLTPLATTGSFEQRLTGRIMCTQLDRGRSRGSRAAAVWHERQIPALPGASCPSRCLCRLGPRGPAGGAPLLWAER